MAINYYDGYLAKDERLEYKLDKVINSKDTKAYYYISIGTKKNLLEVKELKIRESKNKLELYLEEHPLLSSVKNNIEQYYTCTKDKQNQLVQTLSLYNLSIQSNTKYKCMWNSMGQPCEEWTIDELTILSFQIQSYVYPFIRYQQDIEVKIMECKNKEEVEMIEIDYAKVGVSNDEENYDE